MDSVCLRLRAAVKGEQFTTRQEVTMSLKVTDRDGQKYVFDSSLKDFVKRLIQENIELQSRVIEFETENDLLEIKLRGKTEELSSLQKIVDASIAELDR
jgi:hypothetical protein